MCILVPLAVVKLLHKFCGRVANNQRHGFGKHCKRVFFGAFVCDVQRVRFGRERHINYRLCKVHRTFGHSYKVARLIRAYGNFQRARVGKAYVLAGKPRHTPCNVQRVFARFKHPRQPVYGGVGVGVAHRLVQRGYQVIVFLARLVVEERFFLRALFHSFARYGNFALFVHVAVQNCHLQGGKRAARVAVGKFCYRVYDVGRDIYILVAEAASVFQGALYKPCKLFRFKRLQYEYFTARQKCPVHLERWIFSGGAY